MSEDLRLLSIPHEEAVRYEKNFLRTAVCELRFPILLELEEKPPVQLQRILRKKYPIFSIANTVSLGENPSISSSKKFYFESKKGDWTVSFKSTSLSLETSKYTDFEEFVTRLKWVLESVGDFLDTNFFTRVGFRYINAVPLSGGTVEGWINPNLITALQEDVFGSVSLFQSEIRGLIDGGGYTFRHGLDSNNIENGIPNVYMLDFDYFAETVESDEVLSLMGLRGNVWVDIGISG